MKNSKINENNSNQASREMMKQEAIRRMKSLCIFHHTINEFKNNNIVTMSAGEGDLLEATEYADKIKEFEEKTGALVYHLIYTETFFGRLLSVLFVSKYKSDWKIENQAISMFTPYVWCYNLDVPKNSEFGTIYIKSFFGALIRVY